MQARATCTGARNFRRQHLQHAAVFPQIGRASRPSPHVLRRASGKRQQRNIACLLDRQRQASLMRRANAGQSPRDDPAAFGNKLREQTNILVIDSFNLFDAELANFLAAKILATTTAAALAAAAWSARP